MKNLKFNTKDFKNNMVPILGMLALVLAFSVMSNIGFTIDKGYDERDLENEMDMQIHQLVINEVMSSNGGAHVDDQGNNFDWIEIYNGTSREVNLKNYGLSDEADTVKWVFPETIIQPNGYLIVYLSGDNREGLYANFSLKSGGGESLALRNPSGKVVDAVETVKISKNSSLSRNSVGEWIISNKVTPGFENSVQGYEAYINTLVTENTGVCISELLPSNQGNFMIDNKLSGFIEIMNTTDTDVNLLNYSISDDLSTPFKWRLPEVILKPNEVLVIYTSGLDKVDTDLHASFKFNSKNGIAILSNDKGQIVDMIEYENLANGKALTKMGDTLYETGVVTPGYLNDGYTTEEFSNKMNPNRQELLINEVMNSNAGYIPQNGGQYYDWIEIKNYSSNTINLSDYFLSSTANDMKQYQLPDVELKPGGIYVVIASGETKYSNSSYQHTNFKIGAAEGIFLSKGDKLVDTMFISDMPVNYSYGRGSNNGYYYISNPTPGGENNAGTKEIAFAPILETPAGVFNNVDSMQVVVKSPGTIYYTTDGSNPNSSSRRFDGSITLKSTTVLKFVSYENNKMGSEVVTASYIINENHQIPVVSVTLKNSDFRMVTNNPWNTSVEVPAYAELYEEDGSFSIACGFQLFGGSTRGDRKKSFSLKFKKVYGESHLDYQVFEQVEAFRYDTLVLRSGSQDYPVSMIRDELASSIVNGVTELDAQDYKPVALYINGEYWGLYFLREKVDEYFVANNHNVSPEGTNIVRIDGDVMVGSSQNYYSIINYVRNNNMANSANYEYIKTKVNIDSLIDFWVGELYTANNDIINQRYYDNPMVNDGKLRAVFYDLDFGFHNYRHNYYTFLTSGYGSGELGFDNSLIRNLLKNSEFRQHFLERMSYNMKNVWTDERINAKIDELEAMIRSEMPRNQSRWGLKMSTWEKELDVLRYFVSQRRAYLLAHTKAYFKLSDQQMKEYFGE